MRPRISTLPAASQTCGALSCSSTGTGLPSTVTSCGQFSLSPGKGTQSAASTRQRWLKPAPSAWASSCSRPGQAQTWALRAPGAWVARKGQAR